MVNYCNAYLAVTLHQQHWREHCNVASQSALSSGINVLWCSGTHCRPDGSWLEANE